MFRFHFIEETSHERQTGVSGCERMVVSREFPVRSFIQFGSKIVGFDQLHMAACTCFL